MIGVHLGILLILHSQNGRCNKKTLILVVLLPKQVRTLLLKLLAMCHVYHHVPFYSLVKTNCNMQWLVSRMWCNMATF
jgi:hypothetical protein